MYKQLAFAVITTILIYGCGSSSISYKLSEIDSLVNVEKYDSAYQEMKQINPQSIRISEDRAHYNLLLTQTSCLTGNPYPPDSLIDFSISFYEKTMDKGKLCDSYYYKAFYLINKEDYSDAIINCKKAENLASQTSNKYQQYKVTECIAHINEICGNYDLQLQYSKRALYYALEIGKQKWIILAYNGLCEAFLFQDDIDSALVYTEKLIPLIDKFNLQEKPYILNNIGYSYLIKDRQKAKYFFEKSLSLRPMAKTIENLAYVYLQEENYQKAYELWKQAVITNDDIPQDNLLYHILQYDLSHQNLEGACERLEEMVSIKDSLNNVLKDRSIQKIQQEYDENKAQEEHQQEILRWIIAALILVVIILLLLGYIRYKQYKAKIKLTEHQMLINNYQNEIDNLKNNQEGAEQQIAELSQKINDLIEKESPRLYRGKMLYDQIMHNETTVTWIQDDYKCFIDFYKANHFSSYTRVLRKYHPKTVHNTFFLLLYELGKDDKDIRHIMGITQEAVRSTRYRINRNIKK